RRLVCRLSVERYKQDPRRTDPHWGTPSKGKKGRFRVAAGSRHRSCNRDPQLSEPCIRSRKTARERRRAEYAGDVGADGSGGGGGGGGETDSAAKTGAKQQTRRQKKNKRPVSSHPRTPQPPTQPKTPPRPPPPPSP